MRLFGAYALETAAARDSPPSRVDYKKYEATTPSHNITVSACDLRQSTVLCLQQFPISGAAILMRFSKVDQALPPSKTGGPCTRKIAQRSSSLTGQAHFNELTSQEATLNAQAPAVDPPCTPRNNSNHHGLNAHNVFGPPLWCHAQKQWCHPLCHDLSVTVP